MATAALALSACDSRDDGPEPLPVGLSATVDGQPFRASFTLVQEVESGPGGPIYAVSGGIPGAGGIRSITLITPGRVGTHGVQGGEASGGYSTFSPEGEMQMWMASGDLAGASLQIRVTAVDDRRIEGTFAFTAQPLEAGAAPPVVVTDGTFNLAIGEAPPTREARAILDAAQAFEHARRPHAR